MHPVVAKIQLSVTGLNLPQNPTEYLTPQGLHDLTRNPKAVRTWPAQAMPTFSPDYLSDREIELVIAYLKHMAGRKQAQWPSGSNAALPPNWRTVLRRSCNQTVAIERAL